MTMMGYHQSVRDELNYRLFQAPRLERGGALVSGGCCVCRPRQLERNGDSNHLGRRHDGIRTHFLLCPKDEPERVTVYIPVKIVIRI
jgi:hypothetical protein